MKQKKKSNLIIRNQNPDKIKYKASYDEEMDEYEINIELKQRSKR